MRSQRLSCVVIAMALLMALSLPVAAATPLAAGAPDADDLTAMESNLAPGELDRQASPSNEPVDATDTAEIDTSLHDEDGTVTAIARLSELGPIQLQASEDPAADLRAHAERTQQPLVDYADTAAGVEIVNEYWISNAVVLKVDTDRASLRDVARVDGVKRLHENVNVNAPVPTEDPDIESDGGAVETDSVTTNDEPSAAADVNTTYGLDMINAPDVWETYGTMGEGVKVAVLDTGVDVSHPDIDLYTENPDDPTYPGGFANVTLTGEVQTDKRPHDDQFHGTHTSGTVTGGNESGEYIGVAPEADLIHGKVLHGEDGMGSFAGIIAGMEWAVEEDADVISMSLGADGTVPEFVEPVRNARDAGTVVVASAGNSGLGTSGSPGNVPGTIAVGAVDENASVAAFSSGELINTAEAFGDAAPEDWPNEYVVPDVSGPGVNVTSAFPGGDYQAIHGTSMSAPHVSGAAALILSATDTDVPNDIVTDALIDSTWKPEEAPDYKDRRYGQGIIDAQKAVATVKSDTGITGVVERPADNTRLTSVPILINGDVETKTDEIGTHSAPTSPGTHTVSIDLPGFASESTDVRVEEGEYNVADFSLEHVFDLYETDSAPSDAIRGESYEVTYQAWMHDNVTVKQVGDYVGDVTVEVETDSMYGPEELTLGETYEFEDHTVDDYPDEVTLSVTPESNSGVRSTESSLGNVTLEMTVNGTEGTTETTTLGPTAVHDATETHEVAVISDPAVDGTVYNDPEAKELGPRLADRLQTIMGDQHTITHVGGVDAALDNLESYDSFVVQHVEDTDALRTFVEETRGSQTGVVYLDQHGAWSNGVTSLSEATGNPTAVQSNSPELFLRLDPLPFSAVSPEQPDHEILNVSKRSPEEIFYEPEVRDWPDSDIPVLYGSYVSWSSGHHTGDVIGSIAQETEEGMIAPVAVPEPIKASDDDVYGEPVGQSVDELTRTAILNGFGPLDEKRNTYTEERDQMLANAVDWSASGTGTISVTDGPDRKVESGDTLNYSIGARSIENATIELNTEHSTVNESDLSLEIVDANGAHELSFGDQFAPQMPRSGQLTVRVDTDSTAQGEIALEHTYETRNGNVTGATDPISVYEGSEIRVTDGDDLQTAINTVRPGDEVVVEDGSYDRVWIHSENVDVAVRAAAGADPVIRAPEKPAEGFEQRRPLLTVSADGATVDGIDVNASREARPTVDGIRVAHPMDERVENVTLENLNVTGAYNGIQVNRFAHGTTISDVLVTESFDDGITINSADDVMVAKSTVDNSSTSAIVVRNSEATTVRENEIGSSGRAGIFVGEGSTAKVVRNEITTQSTGIEVDSGTFTEVVENSITRASVGVFAELLPSQQSGDGPIHSIEGNDISGKTALHVRFPASLTIPDGTDYSGIQVRGNDLSGSRIAITETTPNAGPLDARLNYYGAAGPTEEEPGASERPTVKGDVLADPFLPTPDVGAESVDDSSFSTSVELAAGESYAVGVPGSVSGAVGDMLTDFDGVVYGFDAETGSWEQRTAGDSVEALDALLVVPETNTTVVMDFGSAGEAPPSPSAHDLEEGWNFVSAPQYAPASESFGHSSAAISVVAPYFEQPGDQLADSDDPDSSFPIGEADETPTVSAFTGYFVFAEDDGQLPARVGEDPTVQSFHAELGIDDRPPVEQFDGEVSDSELSVAMRDGIRAVTADVPDEYQENVSTTFVAAILDEINDLPADERVAFVKIAADDLVTELQSEPVSDTDELETIVNETVEEAALVSGDKTADEDDASGGDDGRSIDASLPESSMIHSTGGITG